MSGLQWLVGTLLAPGNLLLVLLALGTVLWALGWRLGGGLLVGAVVLLLLAIAVLPLGTWLLAPLETRFSLPDPMPDRVDGIVVLGGAVDLAASRATGQPALGGSGERLVAAAELARRYPAARIVFTGGFSGLVDPGPPYEADIARMVLVSLGVDPARLEMGAGARNTAQNAAEALRIAGPAPDERWLLVTSARHMPRSMGAFRKAGWAVEAYPVDPLRRDAGWRFDLTGGLYRVGAALHEWIGLAGYRLRGWSDTLLPAPDAGTEGRDS